MKTVLIVDDDPFVRQSMKRVLRNVDIEIREAENGQEALDLLRGGLSPAIIISDVDMPVLSGLELAQHRKDEFPGIPMVLCSGGAYDLQASALGVDYYAKGNDAPASLRERVLKVLIEGPGGCRGVMQTELRFPIPGANAVGEPIFGDVCTNGNPPVPTQVWRYLKDTSGQQTTYVKREKGRQVGAIAADLSKAIEGMTFEWDTLGQPFNFKIDGRSRTTECPDHHGIAIYVMHGGSEGHLVHVDLRLQPGPEEPGGDGSSMQHVTLFMVKVLTGVEDAQVIARKLEEVLGVL